MPNTIITDTSILIIFQKIDELDILKKVYNKLYTTIEVANEFKDELPEWIYVLPVKDLKYQNFLETQVDIGEASALALASEMEDVLVLIDDLKARKLAQKLNLKYTGTLGIIHKAKQLNVIPLVRPLLDKLMETNFRISDHIISELLTINNEL